MSCSPFDLRDYILGELAEDQRRQVETHAASCAGCREELENLRATRTALLSLPDQEIPQRIAFVSDKVYEPSPVRRWWRALWDSGPRLIFASAAMLSVAMLVAAVQQPPERRIEQAVAKAVAQVEERFDQQRKADLEAVAAAFDTVDRTVKNIHRASFYGGGSQ
ncbi:MAG: zf-HC2 domain-containing protein [Acidobacteria bacterium]|nr:zf-HC2 domain-containing protein [Acidobacteriota bacterium]MBI3473837.1 zf-HC2 domain-containing protein [Candidatus Solibacter usitatus]